MSRYASIKRDPRTRKRPDGTRRSPRFLHISAGLVHVRDEATGLKRVLVVKPGKTFRLKNRQPRQTRQERKVRKLVNRINKGILQ